MVCVADFKTYLNVDYCEDGVDFFRYAFSAFFFSYGKKNTGQNPNTQIKELHFVSLSQDAPFIRFTYCWI